MKEKRQIIALGGGGFSQEPDNLLLDEYILQQSGKEKPKICFIPTAGRDPEDYIERFYQSYSKLNCEPSHLSLVKFPISSDYLEPFILEKDIIFVGGGSTRILMAQWKKWKLNKILKKAWEAGIVLSGMSAGGICWFNDGITNPTDQKLIRLECLGFLEGSFCPHYDERTELRNAYKELVLNGEIGSGYGAEDGAAVHFIGDKFYKAISSRPEAKVYFVKKTGKKLIETKKNIQFLGEKKIKTISDGNSSLSIVNSFIDTINRHDIDGLINLMSEDHIFIDSLGINLKGRDEMKKAWNGFFMLFPDYNIRAENIINKNGVVGIFGIASGTYSSDGQFLEKNRFKIPASWKAIIKGDKITEWRVYADNEQVRKIIERNFKNEK